MNSLKSLCRFAKGSPVACDQVEQDVESLLRGQIRVELIVSLLGFFEAAKDPSNAIHARTLPCVRPRNYGHHRRRVAE